MWNKIYIEINDLLNHCSHDRLDLRKQEEFWVIGRFGGSGLFLIERKDFSQSQGTMIWRKLYMKNEEDIEKKGIYPI